MAAAVARVIQRALRWLMERGEDGQVALEEPEISDAVHEQADDELRDWN